MWEASVATNSIYGDNLASLGRRRPVNVMIQMWRFGWGTLKASNILWMYAPVVSTLLAGFRAAGVAPQFALPDHGKNGDAPLLGEGDVFVWVGEVRVCERYLRGGPIFDASHFSEAPSGWSAACTVGGAAQPQHHDRLLPVGASPHVPYAQQCGRRGQPCLPYPALLHGPHLASPRVTRCGTLRGSTLTRVQSRPPRRSCATFRWRRCLTRPKLRASPRAARRTSVSLAARGSVRLACRASASSSSQQRATPTRRRGWSNRCLTLETPSRGEVVGRGPRAFQPPPTRCHSSLTLHPPALSTESGRAARSTRFSRSRRWASS